MPDDWIVFLLLAFAAEVLGTIGGFGSSLFFVPLAGFFIDFHSVLGVTACFHLTSNLAKLALFKTGIDKKTVLYMGIPAVVCVIAGAWLTRLFDSRWLELGLAVFLIAVSVLLLITKGSLRPNLFNTISGGALSGFTAGLFGTGGAVRGMVLAALTLPKAVFIATSAAIDMGIDLSRSAVYIGLGYLHKDDLYLILALVLISFAGTFTGRKLLEKISEDRFRLLTLSLILVIGVFTLIKAW